MGTISRFVRPQIWLLLGPFSEGQAVDASNLEEGLVIVLSFVLNDLCVDKTSTYLGYEDEKGEGGH